MEKLRLKVTMDRPMGYVDKHGNRYPINYGFIPGVIGGDGEEQDAYVISSDITRPIDSFEGILVAIIHRADDVEQKWVVTDSREALTVDTIAEQTQFLEQYFDSTIEML
jgi:inorganic pyrophosphatase